MLIDEEPGASFELQWLRRAPQETPAADTFEVAAAPEPVAEHAPAEEASLPEPSFRPSRRIRNRAYRRTHSDGSAAESRGARRDSVPQSAAGLRPERLAAQSSAVDASTVDAVVEKLLERFSRSSTTCFRRVCSGRWWKTFSGRKPRRKKSSSRAILFSRSIPQDTSACDTIPPRICCAPPDLGQGGSFREYLMADCVDLRLLRLRAALVFSVRTTCGVVFHGCSAARAASCDSLTSLSLPMRRSRKPKLCPRARLRRRLLSVPPPDRLRAGELHGFAGILPRRCHA